MAPENAVARWYNFENGEFDDHFLYTEEEILEVEKQIEEAPEDSYLKSFSIERLERNTYENEKD